MTIRADGQFNTTIYNENDRFRGIYGSREVVLMNADDMAGLDLAQGDLVTLETAADDGIERRLGGLQVVPYDIPRGGIVGYYPECNVLVPLWHFAEGSKVPAAKSVPVRISRDLVPELTDEHEIPITTVE
jgi:anaerobic selenocysteine-containing dehydrogenase